MKIKLLATCVAVAVLSGCGSDKDSDTSIQAYDGAIQGIAGSFECENGQKGSIPETNSTGYATIDNTTVELYPETCTFTFDQTDADTVDVSNGKKMLGLSLSIPKGLAQAGSTPRATPFTTLVAKFIESSNGAYESYSEDAASEVLTSLGLSDLFNSGGTTIAEIMANPEAAIATVKQNNPTLVAKLIATTHVVSDVLIQAQDSSKNLDVTKMVQAAKNLAAITIAAYPSYDGTSGDVINYQDYTLSTVTEGDLTEDAINTAVDDVKDNYSQPSNPVADTDSDADTDTDTDNDTDTDGSGGTGGTGTGSDGSGTGED